MENYRTRLISLISMMLLIIIPLSANGLGESQSHGEYAISIVDSRGVTISLEEIPQKIVSLSPNITETLFSLGLGDRMVGRTDYCDYPHEAQSIEPMGDLLSPSVEKIVSTDPDLVIISNLGQLQTIEAIEMTGIPVAFIDEPQTMEGTYRIIEQVGEVTGTAKVAAQIVKDMRSEIEKINVSELKDKPSVYYVAGFGEWGDFTATGDTFIHDIITLAGGENIASEAVNWSYQLELLHAKDPDIIILPPLWGSTFEQTYEQFVNHPSYASLSAVKKGKIINIDNNIIERQGPRSAQAVSILATEIDRLSR